MERMINVPLDTITKDDLLGSWQVENRFNPKADRVTIFNKNNYLIFASLEQYVARNGVHVSGNWELIKEKEIIYNPQVVFYHESELIGRTIITRLQNITENNLLFHRLTLYFTNGLELILRK